MSLSILGHAKDYRTGTHIVYANASIPGYLSLIGENFDTFAIQRRRERHKAYERM